MLQDEFKQLPRELLKFGRSPKESVLAIPKALFNLPPEEKAQALKELEEVVNKQLAVTDTQTLLKKLVTEINNEKVSTSLENQAYFNQRDGAWARYYGNYTFAATGCVPSSLAMVFTELARRQITPTEIANYLWNNSNEFNKNYGGTSGKGLVQATKHFGFVPTHLASQSAIVEALQAGHHVLAAVQQYP